MKALMLIVRIILAGIFIFPLIFSMSAPGWSALIILGVGNYLYLLLRSGNPVGLVKCLIPLVMLILFFLGINNWANHNQTENPLGMSLAVIFLAFAGVAVLVFYQEIVTLKYLVPDLKHLIATIKNWRGTGENWLALVVLLPLAAHLYVLFGGMTKI